MENYADIVSTTLALITFGYEVVSWYRSGHQIRSFSQLFVAIFSWFWYRFTGQVISTTKTELGSRKIIENETRTSLSRIGTLRHRFKNEPPSLASIQHEFIELYQ